MNECDGYQIAIEMKLHGAAADPVSRLEAHLASCPACREFETAAKQTEDTMRGDAREEEKTVDWNQLQERIRKLIKWNTPLGSALVILVTFIFIQATNWIDGWALGQAYKGPNWLVTLLWLVTMSVVFSVYNGRRLREVKRAQTSPGKLIDFYRKELDSSIRQTLLTVAILAILVALGAFMWIREFQRGLNSIRPLLSSLPFGALFVGSIVFGLFRELPRLRRERLEFS